MRAAVSSLLAAALLGCAGPAVVREGAVAVRERQGDADSALVLSYSATLCSVTLRDESGRLHDRELRTNGSDPVDMTRSVPSHPWHGFYGPPTLLTVIALPSGRYTLTHYTTSDESEELEPKTDPPSVRTDCTASLDVHATRLPIRIEPGRLTLLELPSGKIDFDALRRMSHALQNAHVKVAVRSWLSAVRSTGSGMHRELAERRRRPQNGYDLYPDCDGKLAVVRRTGTPFEWYARPDDEAGRRAFRAGATAHAPLPARSVQATGFGNGCVKELAFVYLLTDPRELEPLAHALGDMMVTEDLSGEIDLVLSGPIEPVPSAP
jgi:hypothetical protein